MGLMWLWVIPKIHRFITHWIGWRDHFTGKPWKTLYLMGKTIWFSCRFSFQPIHWVTEALVNHLLFPSICPMKCYETWVISDTPNASCSTSSTVPGTAMCGCALLLWRPWLGVGILSCELQTGTRSLRVLYQLVGGLEHDFYFSIYWE